MTVLYILILGTVIWGICHAVRWLRAGSSEERREEEAYRKLMDQLKEEASYYAGRARLGRRNPADRTGIQPAQKP